MSESVSLGTVGAPARDRTRTLFGQTMFYVAVTAGFFALFLGAAARFGLRVIPTFIGLVAGLGLTIAATVAFDLSGLPALPGIALGFLAPNADLIWHDVLPTLRNARDRRRART